MLVTRIVPVLDAADVATVAAFWAALLGGTVEVEDGWSGVVVDGEVRLDVQEAPDHVPPRWPDPAAPQQVHLDLYVADIAVAHARATALGARLLQDADRRAPKGFAIYADPAGHPFCLCWG